MEKVRVCNFKVCLLAELINCFISTWDDDGRFCVVGLPPPDCISANKTEDVCCGIDLQVSHGLTKTQSGYSLSHDPWCLRACNRLDNVV